MLALLLDRLVLRVHNSVQGYSVKGGKYSSLSSRPSDMRREYDDTNTDNAV